MQTIDFLILILAIVGASFAMRAGAQGYPEKSVRLRVPFPPGGNLDLSGRIVAQALTDQTGQTFVVDNRGGAGGMIGGEVVAKAQPDCSAGQKYSRSQASSPNDFR